jgi:hypothetical protein
VFTSSLTDSTFVGFFYISLSLSIAHADIFLPSCGVAVAMSKEDLKGSSMSVCLSVCHVFPRR